MNETGTLAHPAWMAGRILAAMQNGDLADLETGLVRAEQLAVNQPQVGGDVLEQLELLGAVAGQMRLSISRFGRQLTPNLEGLEVHLRLLRHLAAHRASRVASSPATWSASAS
jgi:hypothetical protein